MSIISRSIWGPGGVEKISPFCSRKREERKNELAAIQSQLRILSSSSVNLQPTHRAGLLQLLQSGTSGVDIADREAQGHSRDEYASIWGVGVDSFPSSSVTVLATWGLPLVALFFLEFSRSDRVPDLFSLPDRRAACITVPPIRFIRSFSRSPFPPYTVGKKQKVGRATASHIGRLQQPRVARPGKKKTLVYVRPVAENRQG